MTAKHLNPRLKSETVSDTVEMTANVSKTVTFSPTYCNSSNYVFKQVVRAWPFSTWTNAIVHVADNSGAYSAWNQITFVSLSSQKYAVEVRFFYLE